MVKVAPLIATILTGVALLATACTSSPDPEEAAVANLSKKDQQKLLEYKAEVELGRSMAGRLLQYYGTNGDQALLGYVNQVGNYVASYGDFPERRYMFAILDTDAINAFACPGGYILVTLGTLKLVRNEAELGMILGHEVAHVGKKHMFNTLKSMGTKEVKDEADEMRKKSEKDVVVAAKVRQRPRNDSSLAGAVVARYLSGSAGAGFSLLQAAKAGMNVILEKGLAPELEYEADQEGVRYAIRSGYYPKAMLAFLNRLDKRKRKLDLAVLGKTHPQISDRKSRIGKLLKELKAGSIVGAVGEDRFNKFAKNLGAIKSPDGKAGKEKSKARSSKKKKKSKLKRQKKSK